MMRIFSVLAVVAALLLASCSSGSSTTKKAAAPPAATYAPGPCPQTPTPVPALATAKCGTLTVPEDRSKNNGRTIKLSVATIPAKSPTPAPDPIIHFAGGPGNDGLLFSQTLVDAGVNKDRDLIVMSVRGATTSNPTLVCPELDHHDDSLLDSVYDAPSTAQAQYDATAKCRDRILATYPGIDLSAYNTTEAAADYNDLRKALGIKEWNVFGHSYGTDLGITFVRLYPQGIRSVLLDGLVPPNEATPLWSWKSARESMDAIFAACAAQPACHARYPDPNKTLIDLVNKLEANPLHTTVTMPNGTQREIVMDGGALSNWMIRGAHHGADVPQWLDEMAHGNPTHIATEWAGYKAYDPDTEGTVGFGYYYGVTCSEWAPYANEAAERDQVRKMFPGYPESVLHNAPQLPFLTETCDQVWKVAKGPASVRDLPTTNLRTMLFSGTFDAQTGAGFADGVAAKFTNSMNLKFPGISHGPFVYPCGSSIAVSFWDNPNSPDTSCLPSVTIPPFKT